MTCRVRSLRWLLLVSVAVVGAAPLGAQAADSSANYRLAARFAPYKMRHLIYSTSVNPRWIQGTERFWYEWENSDGKFFYLVDPIAGTKRQIFDNDRIAAELTRITKDPWDGQHLPIRSIKFIDGNTLQFDVQSSQDEEQAETEEDQRQDQERQQQGGRRARPRPK